VWYSCTSRLVFAGPSSPLLESGEGVPLLLERERVPVLYYPLLVDVYVIHMGPTPHTSGALHAPLALFCLLWGPSVVRLYHRNVLRTTHTKTDATIPRTTSLKLNNEKRKTITRARLQQDACNFCQPSTNNRADPTIHRSTYALRPSSPARY